MKFLDGFTEQAYALLRIVAGLLFLAHGVQKFFNFPVAFPMPLNPMLHAAGAIELVAGGLIILGLFTRPAAFLASGMAAVGYWVAHGTQSPFSDRQRRRDDHPLLLHLPVHRDTRRGNLECRRGAGQVKARDETPHTKTGGDSCESPPGTGFTWE